MADHPRRDGLVHQLGREERQRLLHQRRQPRPRHAVTPPSADPHHHRGAPRLLRERPERPREARPTEQVRRASRRCTDPGPGFRYRGRATPWADDVLMVAEVTSFDADTDRRDRIEKPAAYAETGIPVYLLVDREIYSVTVYSEPAGGRYRSVVTLAYGHTVELPGLGITLETEELKEFAR
ncbi:Uma2 family endonuclease [Kitasatospora azatica]|uniref:Uma2 family endonuclease n=1 Tax=Kitasatospora azatica TaxID=58347 RepID=UPI0038990D81